MEADAGQIKKMRNSRTVSLLAASLCVLLAGCAGKGEAPVETTETKQAAVMEIIWETTAPAATEAAAQPEHKDSDLVKIRDYIPDALVDLRYATADNFTGKVIYDFSEPYLRYGTVKKLMAVREDLRQLELNMKIWDGFRPFSAQIKMWEVFPDDTYVADPTIGASNHNRGCAIDLTLVDKEGRELEMPSEFDDFTTQADRDYSDCTEIAAQHAQLLEILMEKHGFKGYYGEWWHFNDTVKYEVEKEFQPE